MNAAPASAYFRTWRDLEALLATRQWTVRASPAIGDGADVLYFVPPPGSDIPTVQVRHLGKALQASVWALRGSAGSMLALDPDTAAGVEARPPQWRVEAMAPGHPVFDTRDSFTLVCGDVLVALGLMDPQQFRDPDDGADALALAIAADVTPPRETATEALQRRVDDMAGWDSVFAAHDAGAVQGRGRLSDGSEAIAVVGNLSDYGGAPREAFAAALMAARRKPAGWRRFAYASAQLWRAVGRRLQRGL